MSSLDDKVRAALGHPDHNGAYRFDWKLSSTRLTDTVRLVMPPRGVLPVVFVPGIMGSNLKSTDGNDSVWRLDAGFAGIPTKVAARWAGEPPGARQSALHPSRVVVDSGGATPKKRIGSITDLSDYTARGWGEVAEASYHAFLLWLEQTLNGEGQNPYFWTDFSFSELKPSTPTSRHTSSTLPPGISMRMQDPPLGFEKGRYLQPILSNDLLKRSGFRMPVYACGYNWLDSNEAAAGHLRDRIQSIIEENNRHGFSCKQVILVTHSMGGLVARRCAMLEEMSAAIAGIVHGVMPAVGAAVAYRRCKVGMWDEDKMAGMVIGSTGRAVTAVFAQAPGALELLPTQEYARDWLKVQDETGTTLETQPVSNPYDDIYLRRDRWWGLVREEWLRPSGGTPITWEIYEKNISYVKNFHIAISASYHPRTYVYYGNDRKQKSFEAVTWRMKSGLRPDNKVPSAEQVNRMGFGEIRDDGNNPLYVGGKLEIMPAIGIGAMPTTYQTSYWELHCHRQDSNGDGTVPASSGHAPLRIGGDNIRQQFRLSGFGHEPAYKNHGAQRATLYSIIKIAAEAETQA